MRGGEKEEEREGRMDGGTLTCLLTVVVVLPSVKEQKARASESLFLPEKFPGTQ